MIEINTKTCDNGIVLVTVTDNDKVLGMFTYDDNNAAYGAMGLLSEVLFTLGYPSKFVRHEEAAK